MKEKSKKIVCDKCEKEFKADELTEFDGFMMCSSCLREHTVTCSCCNHRIWVDNDQGADGVPLCSYCRDNYYCHCSSCNALIHDDNVRYLSDYDDNPYCEDCYQDRQDDDDDLHYINPYSYKPDPIFHGKGIFYGIELEVDKGGMKDNNAYELLKIANHDNDNIYIKQDGSLESGFEIVTHPMSIEYNLTQMPWKEILKKAVSMKYKSHQAGTCGLHCHVSREALGSDYESQEKTISNILFFIEKHWDQMLRFSRRTEDQINKWACRYGFKDSPKEVMQHAKNNSHSLGRYVCVNLSNYNTIELRIFRGTLKYQTFIATLQFVDEIVNVAISLSEDKMKSLSWQDFVVEIDRDSKSELINYLKSKQLYVNEPIIEESEEI